MSENVTIGGNLFIFEELNFNFSHQQKNHDEHILWSSLFLIFFFDL